MGTYPPATLEVDGTYTLSGLLRGRSGSNANAGTVIDGAYFVLLDASTLDQLSIGFDGIGNTYWFKGLSYGVDESAITNVNYFDVDYSAVNKLPYPPKISAIIAVGNGDMTIKWVRRARDKGSWENGYDVPIEADCVPETYEMDVYNGSGEYKFTKTMNGVTEVTITAAEFSAAGIGGAPTFSFKLYQISTLVGRGSPAEGSHS